MKTTALLLPLITLLCGTRIMCTTTRGDSAALDYEESNMIQNDYFIEKRNKPSLSIVNPLDVLRQRLLLEIARRQMKENTRQVELNRAILKNVGKRDYNGKFRNPLSLLPEYQLQLLEQQQQQQEKQFPLQLLYKHSPLARASIFDLYQRQPKLHAAITTYDDIDMDDNDVDVDDDNVAVNKALDIASIKNLPKYKDTENETNDRHFGHGAEITDEHKFKNDVNAAAANRLQYLYQLHKNKFPHK